MLFKKKSSTDPRRTRRPAVGGSGGNAQPVFSYHARSSRTEQGERRSSRLLWSSPPKSVSARKPRYNRSRRVFLIAFAVLVVALIINSLVLSHSPRIVVLDEAGSGQVFLRPEEVYRQAASSIVSASWTNTNKLTFDTSKIAEDMQAQFPELERVSVVLPVLGRHPVFYIQPAKPALLFRTIDGGVFLIDSSGRALMNSSQVTGVEKLGLVVVQDQSGLPVRLGSTALPSGNVDFITEVAAQLKAKKLSITSAILPKGSSELDLGISGLPYVVKFNLKGDARVEAGAFLAVKKHLEREGKVPGSYIDVRVDNRAYYR